MTDPENLYSVEMEENAAELSNVITGYMMQNQLTLQTLDRACEIVEGVYRKNAVIKKAD